MCLVAFAIGLHPRFRLAIAANRDEFHARPSAAAARWADHPSVFGGRDLSSGGSWMAADMRGRVALVTNIRRLPFATGRSRGHLVRELLGLDATIDDQLTRLQRRAGEFSPFNLVAGCVDRLQHLNSLTGVVTPLTQGIHVLSNDTLDTPWPKALHLRTAMERWSAAADPHCDALFDALGDRRQAADHALPDTGVGLERERFLSAPFIVGEPYGTRCSTVYTLDHDGQARLIERSYGPLGAPQGAVELNWRVDL